VEGGEGGGGGDLTDVCSYVFWSKVGAGVVGACVGWSVGLAVGWCVGACVGDVGVAVGACVGAYVGACVGAVGLAVGLPVGIFVGVAVGSEVGEAVGWSVGADVGATVVRKVGAGDGCALEGFVVVVGAPVESGLAVGAMVVAPDTQATTTAAPRALKVNTAPLACDWRSMALFAHGQENEETTNGNERSRSRARAPFAQREPG
jgi:hypothetical protein